MRPTYGHVAMQMMKMIVANPGWMSAFHAAMHAAGGTQSEAEQQDRDR